MTEIHDYLRLLYAKIGIPHCSTRLPDGQVCGREIAKLSTDEIVYRILGACSKEAKKCPTIEILSPVVRSRKGEYSGLLLEMFRRGFSKAYVNGKKCELDPKIKIPLARYKMHNIDILADEVGVND